MKQFLNLTVALMMVVMISACGGGGGGSSLPTPINVADNGNNGGPTRTNEVTEMTEAEAQAALLEEFSVGKKVLALAQEPPPAAFPDSDKNLVVIETDDDENPPISKNEIRFETQPPVFSVEKPKPLPDPVITIDDPVADEKPQPSEEFFVEYQPPPSPPEVTDSSEVTPEIAARRLRLAPYYAALPAHFSPSVLDHPVIMRTEIFRHPRIPAPLDSRKFFPDSEERVEILQWYDREYIGIGTNGRLLRTYLGTVDPQGRPAIYWHSLEFAALGIWVKRNAPVISEFDHLYSHIYSHSPEGERIRPAYPSDTDERAEAVYEVESNAVYRGVNFFPDGELTVDFANDALTGHISANGDTANRADDFGDDGARLPVGASGSRAVTADDVITINFQGRVDEERFFNGYRIINTSMDIIARGFFADLNGDTTGEIVGEFYDDPVTYNPDSLTAPAELSATFSTNNDYLPGGGALAVNELSIGILGKLRRQP